ncbi:MAG: hypothetical protein FWG66_10030 [Spirochaetes bacterium]|nr:hypothetical protein [Spirochaetota bacterium]
MSKIRFAFALAFAPICILLLLAGCEREPPQWETAALPPSQANAVQAAAEQWVAEQEAAADQPYTAAEEAAAQLTWEEAYAVFLSELMQVTGLTWRQAYAAILRELAQVTDGGWRVFDSFFLHDIDGTGTPNLIVFREVGGQLVPRGAYAFEGGVLSPIELGDMPGHLSDLFIPPGDTGIVAFTEFPDIAPMTFNWLELEDGIFRQRVFGWTMFQPEDWDDWSGPWQATFRIDGQEVSADEFSSVFRRWGNSQRMWGLTEENIQNAVFDEAWRQAYAAILRELAIEFTDEFGIHAFFFLYDIDGTGTPNLIVFENEFGLAPGVYPHSAYAFEGGALIQLELGDMPGIVGFLYIPPGTTDIVTGWGFGDAMTFDRLELEADGFRQRVRGILFSTEEVFIDGQEVSADEFWSVFPHGSWNELPGDRPRIRQITEGNIQSAIFGN